MAAFRDTLLPALPDDAAQAALAGRIWRPDVAGPSVVTVRDGDLVDITAAFPTMRDLCEADAPAERLRAAQGERIGRLDDVLTNTPPETRDRNRPWLLAPIDLQAIKAAGVTFAVSMIERVIEERARGDLNAAADAKQIIATFDALLRIAEIEAGARRARFDLVDLSDVAETLADGGFIVAGINHSGDNYFDQSRSAQLSVMLRRPTEINRLIDFMLTANLVGFR